MKYMLCILLVGSVFWLSSCADGNSPAVTAHAGGVGYTQVHTMNGMMMAPMVSSRHQAEADKAKAFFGGRP